MSKRRRKLCMGKDGPEIMGEGDCMFVVMTRQLAFVLL